MRRRTGPALDRRSRSSAPERRSGCRRHRGGALRSRAVPVPAVRCRRSNSRQMPIAAPQGGHWRDSVLSATWIAPRRRPRPYGLGGDAGGDEVHRQSKSPFWFEGLRRETTDEPSADARTWPSENSISSRMPALTAAPAAADGRRDRERARTHARARRGGRAR
jgi:hypothetical protein